MPIKQVLSQGRVPVKIWMGEIEDRAHQQLSNIAELPFIQKHLAAIPEVDTGIGSSHWFGDCLPQGDHCCSGGVIACRLALTTNDLDKKRL